MKHPRLGTGWTRVLTLTDNMTDEEIVDAVEAFIETLPGTIPNDIYWRNQFA